jgi:hypothetical protein
VLSEKNKKTYLARVYLYCQPGSFMRFDWQSNTNKGKGILHFCYGIRDGQPKPMFNYMQTHSACDITVVFQITASLVCLKHLTD